MQDQKDVREIEFQWWHDAVFGPKPFKPAIPHRIARDYLDLMWELSRARSGVDHSLDHLSIRQIKARGNQAYRAERAMETIARSGQKHV